MYFEHVIFEPDTVRFIKIPSRFFLKIASLESRPIKIRRKFIVVR